LSAMGCTATTGALSSLRRLPNHSWTPSPDRVKRCVEAIRMVANCLAGAADALVVAIILARGLAGGEVSLCLLVPSVFGRQTVGLRLIVLQRLALLDVLVVCLLLLLEQKRVLVVALLDASCRLTPVQTDPCDVVARHRALGERQRNHAQQDCQRRIRHGTMKR